MVVYKDVPIRCSVNAQAGIVRAGGFEMRNRYFVDGRLYTTPEEEAEWEMVEARWRGSVFSSLECYEEALGAYEHALQIDPKDSKAWIGKGDTLAYLGRLEEARTAYERAWELDPTADIGKTELLYGTLA
jgi:cytochrome c-type biogenesis protein CcmH/NrfG